MTFEIKQGDALSVLRGMPSESVQTCITSPPYYGLRSYGTAPQVWGNHNGQLAKARAEFEALPRDPRTFYTATRDLLARTNAECEHQWETKPTKQQSTPLAYAGRFGNGEGEGRTVKPTESITISTESAFCLSCNAWRGELGLEPTFGLYISHLIEIFAEVKRVLKKDGTCWVNLGDSYGTQSGNAKDIANGKNVTYGQMEYHDAIAPTNKPNGYHKSLLNIPARFAIAMTDELKMIQRNEIIWYKRACMPSSAKDRFTVDFEKIFFFSREPRYKFNQQLESSVLPADPTGDKRRVDYGGDDGFVDLGLWSGRAGDRGDGTRNKRCVWDVPFEPSGDEHYASYPTKLVEPMILAGTDEGDTVLDIFNGTGTTGLTAVRNRRRYIGIELNEKYVEMTRKRLREIQIKLF